MGYETKPIAETTNFIVLDKYTKIEQDGSFYQSEADLEKELIKDLQNQGYEFLSNLNTPEQLLSNAKVQLQELNDVKFNNSEWSLFRRLFR